MSAPTEAEAISAAAAAAAGSGATPVASSSSLLLVPKVSVVTPRRKEELLVKARAERRRWIEKVPLPYSPESFRPPGSTAAETFPPGSPGNDLWTLSTSSVVGDGRGDALFRIQSSVLCQKYLPSATATISELYGLPTAKPVVAATTAVSSNYEPPFTKPLSMTQVAERVDKLVAPYLGADGDESPLPQTDRSTTDGNDNDNSKITQETTDTKRNMDITSDPAVVQAYHDLWTSLLWPESSVLVQGMRNFLFNFCQNHFNTDDTPSMPAASTALKNYCKSTVDSLIKSNKGLVGSSEDLSRLRRSLESFVYGHVRDVIHKAIDESLESQDQQIKSEDSEHTYIMAPSQFRERLLELQFVQPSHLEIACLQDETGVGASGDGTGTGELQELLKEPIRALLSVDAYHSPFEKLQQVLLVYQGVNAALSKALNKDNNTGASVLPSADDVLPTVILACIKAQPRNLLQNLQFIEWFAAPEYLRGEAGYAFTNLFGAVQFLQDLDLKSSGDGGSNQLSISPEDLKKGLERCRKQRDEMLASKDATVSSKVGINPFTEGTGLPKPLPSIKLSVQEVHTAQLRGETVDLEWAKVRQQQQQPQEAPNVSSTIGAALPQGFKRSYTFLNAQPSDIRVTELAQLLDEYHMLVQVTEDLLSERAARITAERKQRELERQQALGEKLLLGDP